MNICPLPGLGKYSSIQICLFYKILIIISIVIISVAMGYLIGRQGHKRSPGQLTEKKKQIITIIITAAVTALFCYVFYISFLKFPRCEYCGNQIRWRTPYCSVECADNILRSERE